ncbi:MAG: hypothetical protein APF76_01325 [Desulfitibacter sp. BRH_c19]|nr:MAG: hypothetical protein APF76_01325 [Desulfitibacter sp. BRH_c19]
MFIKNEIELQSIIKDGRSIEVELKTKVPPIEELARTVAAFANTQGGVILFGVGENGHIYDTPNGSVGKVVEGAKRLLSPVPPLELTEIYYDGKRISELFVKPTVQGPVLIKGAALKRVGSQIQPADKERIISLLSLKGLPQEELMTILETLAEAVSKQTIEIERLRKQQELENKWTARLGAWIWSGIIGAIIGYIFGLFFI